MVANNHTRNAKRKADSPAEEEESSSRPQRKKQKHRQKKDESEEVVSPSASPVAKHAKGGAGAALQKHLQGLYDAIVNAADNEYGPCPGAFMSKSIHGLNRGNGSDRAIASDFMTLPPKKRYPDYYVTIKKPIALDTILSRIQKEEYDDTEALKADLTLMISNAKKYNQKGSSIYEDAVAIQRIMKEYPNDVPQPLKVTLRQIPPKEKVRAQAPPVAKQTPQQAQEDILSQIENVKEPRTKRVYSEIFMDAPSKKEYPEYYAYIQRVICLNEIKRNVKKGVYKTWAEYEADVALVWTNAMAFNEDGSQVYEDARILKAAFDKANKEKKEELGVSEVKEPHLKVKLNLQQAQPAAPPSSTKIKLQLPQKQAAVATPPAPSPPAPTPPVKRESPILAPQPLPPRQPQVQPQQQQQQTRQGSPLKNQITTSPSKSPPSLRPAPPKPAIVPVAPVVNKDSGVPLTDWARTPQVNPTPRGPMQPQQVGGNNMLRPATLAPPATIKTGVIIPPSQENGVRPTNTIMMGTKRERSMTLIPLVTLSSEGYLHTITSPAPPAPATQTICLTISRDTNEVILNAYLTKDLALHGSYTFTVSSNGRKVAPSIWPDASRRSGTVTTDVIAVARGSPGSPVTPPTASSTVGDQWKFQIPLGEMGSITSIEANCTAFLKRDERGLLVRGERSRTGQAAGEDGGELERVVIIVLRGR